VPRGGSVIIQGEPDLLVGAIRLAVKDTGQGMTPEVRDSLFTDQTISRKIGGTGLGIKIVREAMEAHGGQISVESTPGGGTTFHILLPLQPRVRSSA
jgi:signal transduction histidine kinase